MLVAPPAEPARTTDRAARLAYALALAIGVALIARTFPLGFLLGAGDWLRVPESDVAINIVGQRYFFADAWRWPLLDAMNLWVPQGINIAYLDSIPILALPLKLIAPLLPQGTHAIYLWYVAAWLLQPVAAVWCLRGAGERRLLPALAVAVAAVSMPAWWHRFGHVALCSHFLLLASLGLYLRLVAATVPHRTRLWFAAVVLQLASLLVHPYLAVMVLAVLGAAPATLLLRRSPAWFAAGLGGGAVLAALLVAMALLGYLGAHGGQGFGEFAMDALSPVWPHRSSLFPWPLERLAAPWGDGGEGYNYLGAGLIVGLIAVAALRPRAMVRMAGRHPGLILALAGLTLIALGQRPTAGGTPLFDLGAVPAWLENLRSGGRFFWPVAYALLVGTVCLAARHPDPRYAAVLVTAIGALQFADAAGFRHAVRDRAEHYGRPWSVDVQALRTMLAQAESLTLLPSWHCVPVDDPAADRDDLLQLLLLGSEIGVPVSTVYVARWQGAIHCNDPAYAAAPLGRGELRVLTPAARAAYLPLIPEAARRCAPVGDLTVCHDPDASRPPPTAAALPLPVLASGSVHVLPNEPGVRLLDEGWSAPEPDGVWSQAARATLKVERSEELAGPLELGLELEGFAPADGEQQRVELLADGRRLGRWSLPDRQPTSVRALLPGGAPGPVTLEFRIEAPTRPRDRGLSEDARLLGVRLRELTVTPATGWPRLAAGETRFGTSAGTSAMLASGWHRPEPGGVWSDGKRAELRLDRPPELTGPQELRFRLEALAPDADSPQQVDLLLDGHRLARWSLPDRKADWVSAILPAGTAGPVLLELRVASPTRPVDRGRSADDRWLGVHLQALKVRPASWWQALGLPSL